MTSTAIDTDLRDEIRDIVADVLEVEVEEVSWTAHFQDDLDSDSMRAIELLAQLERRFDVSIKQQELLRMQDLASTYEVVLEARVGK
ncbi:acyl carrier protein [Kitasatospora sp. NPDC087314]|uniref:acyl carrier protein n=1 Tax=Kitasatospora sp. NPDC087314 TaxID=3364068 RepID=UPI0037FF5453